MRSDLRNTNICESAYLWSGGRDYCRLPQLQLSSHPSLVGRIISSSWGLRDGASGISAMHLKDPPPKVGGGRLKMLACCQGAIAAHMYSYRT